VINTANLDGQFVLVPPVLEVGTPFVMTGSPGWLPGVLSDALRQLADADVNVICD
jgi:hypothetical protein